jgi:hypothetical protein
MLTDFHPDFVVSEGITASLGGKPKLITEIA